MTDPRPTTPTRTFRRSHQPPDRDHIVVVMPPARLATMRAELPESSPLAALIHWWFARADWAAYARDPQWSRDMPPSISYRAGLRELWRWDEALRAGTQGVRTVTDGEAPRAAAPAGGRPGDDAAPPVVVTVPWTDVVAHVWQRLEQATATEFWTDLVDHVWQRLDLEDEGTA